MRPVPVESEQKRARDAGAAVKAGKRPRTRSVSLTEATEAATAAAGAGAGAGGAKVKWRKTIRRVLKDFGATASQGMKKKLLRKRVLAALGPQLRAAEDAKAAGLKALFRAKLAACKEARPSDDGKTVFLDRRKK